LLIPRNRAGPAGTGPQPPPFASRKERLLAGRKVTIAGASLPARRMADPHVARLALVLLATIAFGTCKGSAEFF